MSGNISQQDASLEGLIEWTSSPVHLRDFADNYGVPNLAKVIKGQYRDVGVAKSVQSELYIHTVETSQKVLAEGVKVKEGKRVVISANQKYSLPLSYQGWFELLSQDGKAVKAITSVQELTRLFPANCIVRENIKAYVPRDSGELTMDKTRTLLGGEQLKLVGEIWVTVNTTKGMVKRRLLQCLDVKSESVYLAYEQKGLFSPIAGQTNISGVHNLRGLLDKFRFPILVRLVHGIIPSKLEKNFTGVFRLNGVYSEESVFVCPLKKDAKMVPISTREPLKLVAAANFEDVMLSDGYLYHSDRCQRMIASYMNSIHLLFTMPDPNSVKAKKEEIVESNKTRKNEKAAMPVGSEEDILFEEVEDIYAYVREGGPTPPPPRPRPARDLSTISLGPPPAPQGQSPLPRSASGSRLVEERALAKADSPKPPKLDIPERAAASAADPRQRKQQQRSRRPPETSHSPPFTPTKDDFWEEPIYEPLDKIRRHKSTKKVEERIPAPVVISPVEETPIVVPPPPTSAPVKRSSSSVQRRDTEVQNLRQVYKYSHENIAVPAVRPSLNDDDIDELNDMLEDINAPPVPPKKFADPETGVDPEFETSFDKPNYNSFDSPIESSFDKPPTGGAIGYNSSPYEASFDKPSFDAIQTAELEASGETAMTFEEERDVNDVQRNSPLSPSPVPAPSPVPTSPAILQSDIPVSPEPTVIVHTPIAPVEHSRSFTHLQQPQPMSQPPQHHYTQSHELLTDHAPASSSSSHNSPAQTFVYKTSLPPPTSTTNTTQNGYSGNGLHVQKVVLNKPKEMQDVHVLNRRATMTGSGQSGSRPLGMAHATSGLHVSHRTSMNRGHSGGGGGGGGSGLTPYSTDAPYVAVARVGDAVGATGLRTDPRQISRQRKMQSMYL